MLFCFGVCCCGFLLSSLVLVVCVGFCLGFFVVVCLVILWWLLSESHINALAIKKLQPMK